MSLFNMLFHKDTAQLATLDKKAAQAMKDLKEMLQAYHVKLILVQELISAERGSKDGEKKIDDILTRLAQFVKADEKLSKEETGFVDAAEPILQKLIGSEKDADLKKEEMSIVESLEYFQQDLAKVDGFVQQQSLLFEKQNIDKLRHPDEAAKVAELAKKEAAVLFGIEGRRSSEETLLKDIIKRIEKLMEEKGVKPK